MMFVVGRSLSAGVVAALLVSGVPASAQDPGRPPGSARGLFGAGAQADPGRTTQRLDSTFDLGGGYDSNFFMDAPVDASETQQSGFATTVTGLMRYWRGKTTRSFQAFGRGYVNYQSVSASQFAGGEANLQGTTALGRRSGIVAVIGATYDPAVLSNGFASPIDTSVPTELPTADVLPPVGVAGQRFVAGYGSASFHRMWTPRQRFEAQYSQRRSRPTVGPGLDSDSKLAMMSHSWSFRPTSLLRWTYRYDNNRQDGPDLQFAPVDSHTAEMSAELERRLSPTRSLRFVARGAVTYVAVEPIIAGRDTGTALPVGGASLRADVSRNWQLLGSVQRSASVLAGITPEPFASNDAELSLNGRVGGRVSLGVGGTLSRGSSIRSESGSFEAVTGFSNLQYRFASCCSVFSSYVYYKHTLEQVAVVSGFPTVFENHAARVGVTVWLPLYGIF